MSGLHLVRVPLDVRGLAAFAVAERVDDDDRGYADHLAMRRRFGPAAPQPFRLFQEGPAGPHVLGYAMDAPALLDAAALRPVDSRLDHAMALAALTVARQLAVWFHRSFGDRTFRPGPFQPPRSPPDATAALREELDRCAPNVLSR